MNEFYGFKEHVPAHKMSSCSLNTKKYNWGGPSGFYTTRKESKSTVQFEFMKGAKRAPTHSMAIQA